MIEIAPDLVNAQPQPTVIYVPEIMTPRPGRRDRRQGRRQSGSLYRPAAHQRQATGFGNENNYAATLKIFGLPTCNYIDLKTKSSTYATIYAPDADLDLYNSRRLLREHHRRQLRNEKQRKFLF